jgi:hypothetical protein
MLLTAEAHKRHHTEFDVNFCIFNGWANPLLNRVRQLLSFVGLYPIVPPTAQNRLDAAADLAASKKLGNRTPAEATGKATSKATGKATKRVSAK